jgi:hypothetical protein
VKPRSAILSSVRTASSFADVRSMVDLTLDGNERRDTVPWAFSSPVLQHQTTALIARIPSASPRGGAVAGFANRLRSAGPPQTWRRGPSQTNNETGPPYGGQATIARAQTQAERSHRTLSGNVRIRS